MLIKWKRTGLLFAVCPLTKKNIKILGGINEIPDETWKALAPSFKAHIKAGNLVEIHGKTTFKEVPVKDEAGKDTKEVKTEVGTAGAKTFKSLTINEREELIKETNSTEQLEAWKSETSNESLRLVIQKKIELVLNPPDED